MARTPLAVWDAVSAQPPRGLRVGGSLPYPVRGIIVHTRRLTGGSNRIKVAGRVIPPSFPRRRLRLLLAFCALLSVSLFWLLPSASGDGFTASSYHDLVLDSDPVAYWRMNGPSGPTPDDSGHDFTLLWQRSNPYDPSLTGYPEFRVPGLPLLEPDRALWIDATQSGQPRGRLDDLDFVDAFDTLDPSLSVEAWVKLDRLPSGAPGSDEVVVSSRGYHPWDWSYKEGYMLYLRPWGGGVNRFTFEAGSGYMAAETSMITNNTQVQTGRWYHLVATLDESQYPMTMHLYVDGEESNSWVVSNTQYYQPNTSYPTRVGLGTDAQALDAFPFTGSLDEIAVYDSALTAEDVKEHYLTGAYGVAPELDDAHPPTISGTLRDGQLLSATSGTWVGGTTPISYSYQWNRDGDPIASATGSTYRLTPDDAGSSLSVSVTARNSRTAAPGETAPVAESAETGTILAAPPVNDPLYPPTISGTTRDGETLTAVPGTWTGTPTIELSYRWQRCNASGELESCADLGEGIGEEQTYTLAREDVGHRMRVVVSASNDAPESPTVAYSALTEVVARIPPSNTTRPAISVVMEEDDEDELPRDYRKLHVSEGTWAGDYGDSAISFQWLRCDTEGFGCSSISGAMEQDYTLAHADVGHRIRVQVTFASPGFDPVSAVSEPTVAVLAAPPSILEGNEHRPEVTPLDGEVKDGKRLEASTGDWKGTPLSEEKDFDFAYQWRRCNADGEDCSNIDGADSSRYTLTSDDVDHTIRASVTATNAAGSASALSLATPMGEAIPPENTLPPSIGGWAEVEVGKKLNASRGQWTGSAPDFSYQWYRCDEKGGSCLYIPGADARDLDYTVTGLDVDHRLKIVVTADNSAPGSATAESELTATVYGWSSYDAHYSLRLTAEPKSVLAGETVNYTVEVVNAREDAIYFEQLNVTLPEDFSFVSGSTRGAVSIEPVVEGRSISWSGTPEVAAQGGLATFEFQVQAGKRSGTFTSDIEGRPAGVEPASVSGVAPVTIESEPAFGLESDVAWVPKGSSATITGTLINPTPSLLTLSNITATLPSGVAYKPGTSSAYLGEPVIDGQTLRWAATPNVLGGSERKLAFAITNAEATGEFTVTTEVDIAAGEPIVRNLTVSSSANANIKTYSASVLLSGEAKNYLAYKFRPYLRFDSREAWRPLNVEMLLEEKGDDGDYRHRICVRNPNGGPAICTGRKYDHNCRKPTAQDLYSWTGCNLFLAAEYLITTGRDRTIEDEWEPFIDISKNVNSPGLDDCSEETDGRLCDDNDGPRTGYYYHAVKNPDPKDNLLYLDYFFFYRQNQTPNPIRDLRQAMHRADWEGVLVATAPRPSELPIYDDDFDDEYLDCQRHDVAWVAFHAHGDLFRYGCEVLSWGDRTHVRAFVAEGTHASYPRACDRDDCLQNAVVGSVPEAYPGEYQNEGRFDGEAVWGWNTQNCKRGGCLLPIAEFPDPGLLGDPWWAFWQGNWGGSESTTVLGPGGDRNVFDHPWRERVTPCERSIFNSGDEGDLCAKKVSTCDTGGKDCKKTVPNVTGKKKVDAIKKLEAAGLKWAIRETITLSKPENTVLTQDPKPTSETKEKAASGCTVTLIVASRDRVPDVTGLTAAHAKEVLTSDPHNLVISKQKREKSKKVIKGRVTRTQPKANAKVKKGDMIKIWVSKGNGFKMPGIDGWGPEGAKSYLERWDLKVKRPYKSAGLSRVGRGLVAKTSPAEGEKIYEGDSVIFYISKGKATNVPRITGLRGQEAKEAVKQAGLEPKRQNAPNCSKRIVTKQAPEAGKRVAEGTKVKYWVKCATGGSLLVTRDHSRKYSVAFEPWRVIPRTLGTVDPITSDLLSGAKEGKRKRGALEEEESENSCSDWFGPLVVMLACDETRLREVEANDYKTGGTFEIDVNAGDGEATKGPGIAQVVKTTALEPGDSASLFGTAPDGTKLGVRLATADGGLAEAVFDDVGLAHGGRVEFQIDDDGSRGTRDGVPDAALLIEDEVVLPSVIIVRPGAPRIRRVEETAKRLNLSFLATSSKTGITVSGKHSSIASFVVHTRKNRVKRISIPLVGRTPYDVSLVSYGEGTISPTSAVARPASPRRLKVNRNKRGMRVSFEASTRKTRVRILGARNEVIAARSISTRPGRRVIVTIPLGRAKRGNVVELISCGPYGFKSRPVYRRLGQDLAR